MRVILRRIAGVHSVFGVLVLPQSALPALLRLLALAIVLPALRLLPLVLSMLHVLHRLPRLQVLPVTSGMLPGRERGSGHDHCRRRRSNEGEEKTSICHRPVSGVGNRNVVAIQNQKRTPATRRVSLPRPPASRKRSFVSPYLFTHSTPMYGANWRVIS